MTPLWCQPCFQGSLPDGPSAPGGPQAACGLATGPGADLGSGLVCAPPCVGPTAAGYVFTLNVPTASIFRGDAAELLVSVRNAQGQPVDGVPVFFQVEPT